MISRYLISTLMICGALSACSDKQDATSQGQIEAQPQAAQIDQSKQTLQTTQSNQAAQTILQQSPFANANKAPTRETQRMADLLNKSGKAEGSFAGATQAQGNAQ